jgi:hypothetical protein
MTHEISVDVGDYLMDCPPWDGDAEGLTDDILLDVAAEVALNFDSTSIYDQIDRLTCQILRERGITPSNEHP